MILCLAERVVHVIIIGDRTFFEINIKTFNHHIKSISTAIPSFLTGCNTRGVTSDNLCYRRPAIGRLSGCSTIPVRWCPSFRCLLLGLRWRGCCSNRQHSVSECPQYLFRGKPAEE